MAQAPDAEKISKMNLETKGLVVAAARTVQQNCRVREIPRRPARTIVLHHQAELQSYLQDFQAAAGQIARDLGGVPGPAPTAGAQATAEGRLA